MNDLMVNSKDKETYIYFSIIFIYHCIIACIKQKNIHMLLFQFVLFEYLVFIS